MSTIPVAEAAISRVLDLSQWGMPLDAVIDALPAAVYTTDANGVLQHYNKAAAELWGCSPDMGDAKWCGSWRLYYTDGRPMAHDECPMARAIRTGKPVRGEAAVAERPDGSRVTFLACPTPIRGEGGTIVGAVNMLVDITERNAMEAMLRKRESELTDFVENANQSMHWVGPDGVIKWANRAEMELLGYPPDEYIGRHIAEFHADSALIEDILAGLSRRETLKNVEARLVCKDGTIKYVRINSSAYVEDGEFIHTRCFTTEITAEKTAELRMAMALSVSQLLSRSNSLKDAAPELLDQLATSFNAGISEIWICADDLRCQHFHSRLPAEQTDAFRKTTESLIFAKGTGLPGMVWERMAPVWISDVSNSSLFPRAAAAKEIGLGDGFAFPILSGPNCLGVITLLMGGSTKADSTLMSIIASVGYKVGQFMERVREAEQKRQLAGIVEASRDAVVSVSMGDIVTSWNSGAERLFGYTVDEIVGQSVSSIVPDECAQLRSRQLQALRNGLTVEPFETVRRDKAGELIPVSLGYSPVRDADGNLISIAATIRDISARKTTEEQLTRRMRQLQAVSELGYLALSCDEPQVLFDAVVTRIAEELDVELVKILELQPGGRHMLLRSGVGWQSGLVGSAKVDTGLDSQAGYTLSVNQAVIVKDLTAETRFNGPPLLHDHGVISGVSVVIAGASQSPFGVLGAHSKVRRAFSQDDVNFVQSVANILASAIEGSAQEDQQKLLIHELTHRVKNLLMVIQAVAEQTGRWSTDIKSFMEGFKGRLDALAHAHDLLTADSWSGTEFHALAARVLGAQADRPRFRLELDPISLNSSGTQMLTMVLHEMATNAVKYGAFSNTAGIVTLRGNRTAGEQGPLYRIVWSESGGPEVSPPDRAGFGSTMVMRTIKKHCGGTLHADWRREGLVVEIAVPTKALEAPTKALEAAAIEEGTGSQALRVSPHSPFQP